MSKVLLFSDPHVHPHKQSAQRLKHCLDTLDWVYQVAEDRNIDSVICLGDLYHDRQKIDVLTYQRVFEILEKRHSERDVQSWYLLGNHDLWHLDKWDISSVFPLRSIKGVNIVDKPCTLDIAGKPISFLPYTHNPISDLEKIENNSDWKILMGHVAVDGAIWNTLHGTRAEVSVEHDGDMKIVDANVFQHWNEVFLGHYHAQQRLSDNVEYIGSPLQLSFGEAFQDKHIIILDLKTHKREYIINDFSPKHFIIRQKDIESYDLEGNFVKILVDDIGKSDIADMRHELATKYDMGSLEINQVETVAAGQENVVVEAKSILAQGGDMLQKYIDIQNEWGGIAGLDKDLLLEIGLKISRNKAA